MIPTTSFNIFFTLMFSLSQCHVPLPLSARSVVNPACQDTAEYCPNLNFRCLEPIIQTECPLTCHHCDGCYDINEDTCKVNQENPDRCLEESFNQNCQATCKMCQLGCRNKLTNEWCEYFKKQKDDSCANSYLRKVCPFECGVCTPSCSDILDRDLCLHYKNTGQCGRNYATNYCRATCNKCIGVCRNEREDCPGNERRCDEDFFKTNCKELCRLC